MLKASGVSWYKRLYVKWQTTFRCLNSKFEGIKYSRLTQVINFPKPSFLHLKKYHRALWVWAKFLMILTHITPKVLRIWTVRSTAAPYALYSNIYSQINYNRSNWLNIRTIKYRASRGRLSLQNAWCNLIKKTFLFKTFLQVDLRVLGKCKRPQRKRMDNYLETAVQGSICVRITNFWYSKVFVNLSQLNYTNVSLVKHLLLVTTLAYHFACFSALKSVQWYWTSFKAYNSDFGSWKTKNGWTLFELPFLSEWRCACLLQDLVHDFQID